MIKIDNAKLKEICDEYSDDVAKINRYVGTKKNKYLNYLFCERDFREVISCPPMRFAKEIELFRNKFFPTDYNDKEWLSFKTYMKGQYEKVRKSYLYNVLKSLDIKVCPYCNRQYIFNVDNGRKVSAQFDHFYSKSEYPYLALSFYNLIPCCPTCNKAKGETQIVINPYAEGFEDKGRIIIDSLMNCVLHDADWTVKLDTDARCATNVSAFVLDELYQKHKDYAHEIVWKIIANERGYLESLINTFKEMGLNDDLIQRVLWGIYLDEDKMLDKPLSKMTLDILKQLKGT